jgi:hypothetical protein
MSVLLFVVRVREVRFLGLVVWRAFVGGVATFGRLCDGLEFVFKACEARFEFLDSAKEVEEGVVECVEVVLEVSDGGFDAFEALVDGTGMMGVRH